MSRTTRIDPRRYIKVPDGQYWWKCKCNWCINIDYRDRFKLTKKEINSMINDKLNSS